MNYYHSIQVETLAEILWKNLQEELSDQPFQDLFIIIPHQTFQTWLLYYITKFFIGNEKVLANLQFGRLEDSIRNFVHESTLTKNPQIQIPYENLGKMQAAIYQYLEENPNCLVDIGIQGISFSGNPAILFQLSKKLSFLFYQYELNQKDWIQKWWEEKKNPQKESNFEDKYYNFQKKLYQDIFLPSIDQPFPKTLNQWLYHSLGILPLIDLSKKETPTFSGNPKVVHVFCLSYIAPGYLDIFQTLSTKYNYRFHFYQLEPENPLPDSQPFHSWTKAIQGIHQYFQKNFQEKYEKIFLSFEKNHSKREGLKDLQNILSPSPVPTQKISLNPSQTASADSSVRFWNAPSLFREVEAVYHDILYKIQENPELTYEDFAIFVTDIPSYQPALDWIFNGGMVVETKESSSQNTQLKQISIPYSLSDLDGRDVSYLYQALQEIWILCERDRIPISSIVRLLKNPAIFQNIPIEEKENILEQIQSLGTQYEEEKEPIQDPYTFSYGLLRSRLSTIVSTEFSWNQFTIPTLSYLSEREAYSISFFWNQILKIKDLCDQFLVCNSWNPENLYEFSYQLLDVLDVSSQEKYYFQKWQTGLMNWAEYKPSSKSKDKIFPFIALITKSIFEKIQVQTHTHLKNGVSVASPIRLRGVPFTHIYFLGLGEGKFVGSYDQSLMNLLYHYSSQNPYYISPKEINQSLLWETIHSAKESITFSYVGKDLLKDRILEPCSEYYLLMQELGIQKPTEIPIHGYSNRYKHTEEELKEGLVSYDFSKAWIHNPKMKSQFLSQFSNPQNSQNLTSSKENAKKSLTQVDLKELSQFLKNPMEYYVKKNLGIYEDIEELEEWKDEETWILDYASKSNILKELYSAYFQNLHLIDNLDCSSSTNSPKNSASLRKLVESIFTKKIQSAEFPIRSFQKRQEMEILKDFQIALSIWSSILSEWNLKKEKLKFFDTIALGDTGIRKLNLNKIPKNIHLNGVEIVHEWNYGIFHEDNRCFLIYPRKIRFEFPKNYNRYNNWFPNFFQDSSHLFLTLIAFKILNIPLVVMNIPYSNPEFVHLFFTSRDLFTKDHKNSIHQNLKNYGIEKVHFYYFSMEQEDCEKYIQKLISRFQTNEFIHFCPNHFLLYIATRENSNLQCLKKIFPNLDTKEFQLFIQNQTDSSIDLLPNLIQFFYRAEDILKNLDLGFAKEFYTPYTFIEEL